LPSDLVVSLLKKESRPMKTGVIYLMASLVINKTGTSLRNNLLLML